MTRTTYMIAYPDGDVQEIDRRLTINQLVDLNGVPLALPLATTRMIVYRVFRINTDARKGEETVLFHLELVRRDELEEM